MIISSSPLFGVVHNSLVRKHAFKSMYYLKDFFYNITSFLSGRPVIDPKMFTQEDVIKKYSSEYLFIGCIDYITKVGKTGILFIYYFRNFVLIGIKSLEGKIRRIF